MGSPAANLVNKVWNYCNLLRDDGVSYGGEPARHHGVPYGIARSMCAVCHFLAEDS
jgi:hypothetical protein